MYEAFYGLSSKPFQLNPDPTFYFGSKQHSRARAYLEYGISRNEGFVVVTGEIGAGKTTIVRKLIESLHGTNVVIGQLVTTQLDAEDTLRMVGAAFGFNIKGVPKSELLITLEAFLVAQTGQGKRCLLIVDEAQNLTMRAVEELRMLSNFQFGNQALLQSFLVGQPEFREIMRRPEMEQFRQRVAASCHIGPLDENESRAYIQHRLNRAGATDRPTFDDAAFSAIYAATQGIPRRINSLCDRLLLLGFLNDKTHFGFPEVDEVVRDIAEETRPPGIPEGVTSNGDLTELRGSSLGSGADLDLSRIKLDPDTAQRLKHYLAAIGSEHGASELQRVEVGVLRLERLSRHMLLTLQKLLDAVETPTEQGAP